MPLTRRDFVFLLVAIGVVTLYVAIAGGGFPLDDSWIHQVYARNLAEHGEWAFVHGEPSAASTSPLYTVALAIGYVLGLPYALWTHLLGVLALTVTAMLGARLAEQFLPNNRFAGWLTGLALLLTWHLIWAAASGMETMIFAMFTLMLVYLAGTWHAMSLQHGFGFGVMAALATMTRPEGALLAGSCGLMVLIVHRRNAVRWCSGAFVGFAIAISPYLVLNLSLTGGLLPATAAAKYAQHQPLLQLSYLQRVFNLTVPILAGGQFLLLPGICFFNWRCFKQGRQDRKAWFGFLPLLWAMALIGLYAARLPAAYQHGRYVMPVLPGLIVTGVIGTAYLFVWGARSPVRRVATRSLAISTVMVMIYFALILGPSVYRKDVRIIEEEMVAAAHWIDANLPENERLAIHDIGAVGYFAPRPILDIAGLISEDVLPAIGDPDALWALMQAHDARYLMAFDDQIPGRNPADARLCFLFQSDGRQSIEAGGSKMVIYAIAWDEVCEL